MQVRTHFVVVIDHTVSYVVFERVILSNEYLLHVFIHHKSISLVSIKVVSKAFHVILYTTSKNSYFSPAKSMTLNI